MFSKGTWRNHGVFTLLMGRLVFCAISPHNRVDMGQAFYGPPVSKEMAIEAVTAVIQMSYR